MDASVSYILHVCPLRPARRTKGATLAVDDLSFEVGPGIVTGFLYTRGRPPNAVDAMLMVRSVGVTYWARTPP